ncbi:hypothetical protein Rsub_08838 [Raphidocelis subcapitata]|uniref:Uncharacterized protein n=1 Tax=Raphidocelis subcapitata TaxID=307507 RepID=A0A2V0PDQ0_9CHLO|nr:hypothetical protein Rsub_08838 [Raphidocelis subcapitata]|eukprot:GBF96023.1 hypothetical protein Rsub_08838 [Raphidocelis subcapitata]
MPPLRGAGAADGALQSSAAGGCDGQQQLQPARRAAGPARARRRQPGEEPRRWWQRPQQQQQQQQASPTRLPRWLFGLGLAAAHQTGAAASAAAALARPAAAAGGGPPPPAAAGQGGGGGGGGGAGAQPLAAVAAAPEPVVLTVASFAVTKMAYVRLTKAFREDYLRATGVDVRFRLTFTGSGVQVDKVLDAKPAAARQAAHEFARFCFTPPAQVEFGRVGFRPNPKLCREQPEHLAGQRSVKLWNVEDALGGWSAAQKKFFDAGQILDRIQSEVGARRMARGKAGAAVLRHAAA